MNGQGRPIAGDARWRMVLFQFLIGWIVRCCALLGASQLALAEDSLDLRLQIAWGGREAKLWRGYIHIPQGELSDIRLLGLDADQPGSFVIPGEEVQATSDRILISPRFANNWSGLEVSISAPRDAELVISLTQDSKPIRIPLQELRTETHTASLGNEHRLRIARASGDRLRIRTRRKSMVFAPNDRIRIDAMAHEIDAKPGTSLRARFRVRAAEDRRSDVAIWKNLIDEGDWTHEELLKVGEAGRTRPMTDIEIPIPSKEGVYNLAIELSHALPQVGTLARRTVQFVVIDSESEKAAQENAQQTSKVVTDFNPAEPRWWEQLPQWKILPRTRRGPWSNQSTKTWQQQGKRWTQLEQDGWIAYPLHVDQTGVPHILDIEFPAGVTQDVGISILEPGVDGAEPIALNTGVMIGDPDVSLAKPPGPVRNRLVFWPRTTGAIVLLSNSGSAGPASFGRIRLESFEQGLPQKSLTPRRQMRQRIAVIDGHQLRNLFLAKTAFNETTKVGFDDWQTFYDIGSRLIEYLQFAGFDGVSLTVHNQGSSLYSSQYLNPTPSMDRGVFATLGQDPYRKDVFELLMRMFDRAGLTLIAGVEFATPLPELEQMLAKQTTPEGIELVDLYGRKGADVQRGESGQAAYYNPLDSRVQTAMQHVVDELVQRYAHHQSFGGVNIQFANKDFTHLPDLGWAFDATTLAEFHRALTGLGIDSNLNNLENLGRQLQQDIAVKQSTNLTQRWLAWRAARMSQHYERLSDVVRSIDENDQLYLSLAALADSGPWQRHLRPTLPRKTSVDAAMLELGLDVSELRSQKNLVLLRPQAVASMKDLSSQAIAMELRERDVQQSFHQDGGGASQFLHQSHSLDLDSLELLGEAYAANATSMVTPVTRTGVDVNQPFARSLAHFDDQIIFEGGALVPLGQEAMANSFFRVYRQLPAIPFKTVQLEGSSPLVVRKANANGETFIYAVNPSPWSVQANLQWKAPGATVSSVGGKGFETKNLFDRADADITINAYGLVLFRFSSENVDLLACRTELPAGIAKDLRVQLDEVISRADFVEQSDAPVSVLRDPGFESSLTDSPDAAWTFSRAPDGTVANDYTTRAAGNSSLRLKAITGPVAITSHEFTAPTTGRFVVSLKLRASRPMRTPLLLRLKSSDPNYQPTHRFTEDLTTEFQQIEVPFNNLPNDPNLRLKLHVEMIDAGEVWVDDIQINDKSFLPEEQDALRLILQFAYEQQSKGDLSTCYEILTSYWPRFLLRHVAPVKVATRPVRNGNRPAARPTPTRPTPQRLPAEKESKPRFLDKLKRYVPRVPNLRFR